MKFLLDENFPKAAIPFLEAAGHDVFDFRGTGDEGIDDSEVFQKAQDHAAILLTTDRDFFHTIPHRFDSHCGVIVIALRQPNRRAILARLEWILSQVGDYQFNNRVFQLRDSTWLAYPPIGTEFP
jgi:predicted nuclease of predicted toxin-antitoxin system